jgi:hypothetical protein
LEEKEYLCYNKKINNNMINENSFINQPPTEGKRENPRTKESAILELMEKFGLGNTSDFQSALQQGKIELAETWLNYITENNQNFPQYEATWDSWLNDRQKDIEFYKNLKSDGSLETMIPRTKAEAQAELQKKFGFADTKGFRQALQNNVQVAEEWLNYIIANKMSFPQYLASWANWLRDRQQELADAKK